MLTIQEFLHSGKRQNMVWKATTKQTREKLVYFSRLEFSDLEPSMIEPPAGLTLITNGPFIKTIRQLVHPQVQVERTDLIHIIRG